MGYAEIALYLYVGPGDDFDVEECEACTVPDNENYVAFYFVIPCMPVCKPEVPDCLDGPMVVLGDIEHERDVCLYDNMPIMLNEESMNTDSVEFYVDNTWPTGSEISSISVSYMEPESGALQCTNFEDKNGRNFVRSGAIKTFCEAGVSSIIVEIHSEKIDYRADQLSPNACEPIKSTT